MKVTALFALALATLAVASPIAEAEQLEKRQYPPAPPNDTNEVNKETISCCSSQGRIFTFNLSRFMRK